MQTLNWNDLRFFLAVARGGGLMAAARRLEVDQTTVARRLAALEAAIGARLIDRSSRGVTLTGQGMALVEHAERIEAETIAAAARLGVEGQPLSGVVRLATPEAFGAGLVAPAAKAFHDKYPGLQLELVPESRSVNLSRREADIAISLSRPTHGRLVARRLADYTLGLYASRAYLEAHGPLRSLADLPGRPLVWYIDEMIDVPELRYLDQVADGAPTMFRSNSIAAQQAAVASGLGFGVLHKFAASEDPRLVRVLPDALDLRRSYWLCVHADQARIPRVRAVMDFLSEIIAARQKDL
ncbi:LysR family transcriptional regulator [Caulobacter segnis]|uniref:LysR family transcriptional regulator n=1 Tax=Caulobacter segnis TaxID=88688 RepID=A0A2W5V1U7_9CAUL|nr:LysR family transcriptional regulator [Caulobacter segnis]PZR31793.1 MAG: LysR family transcriptional regulator [Caulobacter segnis]